MTGLPQSLDVRSLEEGARLLSALDPDLSRLHRDLGLPPLWERAPGFPTLVYIILEQQVSLASARAAFERLEGRLGIIEPASLLRLSDDELKRIGFSRQKTGYARGLALSILSGELDLDALQAMDDGSARETLLRVKGIGPWTADIYLLMALLRPDVWPAGDLALATAVQEIKRLEARPDPAMLEQIAAPWKPWRAVAARLFWQYYLASRRAAGSKRVG